MTAQAGELLSHIDNDDGGSSVCHSDEDTWPSHAVVARMLDPDVRTVSEPIPSIGDGLEPTFTDSRGVQRPGSSPAGATGKPSFPLPQEARP